MSDEQQEKAIFEAGIMGASTIKFVDSGADVELPPEECSCSTPFVPITPKPTAGEVVREIMKSIEKDKLELDSEILAAIRKFEAKTGIEVQSIDVVRWRTIGEFGSEPIVRISAGLRELR